MRVNIVEECRRRLKTMVLAANVLDFVEMFLIATDSDKFAMCGGRNDCCIPPSRVQK